MLSFIFFSVINCTVLEDPDNGSHELIDGSLSFGSEVKYSCDDGFVLNGDNSRICQADGHWTGSAPICTSKVSHDRKYSIQVPLRTVILYLLSLLVIWCSFAKQLKKLSHALRLKFN